MTAPFTQRRLRRHLGLAVVLSVLAHAACAQATRPDPFPNQSAAQLMQTYRSGTADPMRRQEQLIGILNKTLPATDTNLAAARECLAKANALEEKVLLIKVLASMYEPRSRSRRNLQIESDIRKLTESGDKRLAAEAVVEYSRLGYPVDRYQVLQRAHAARIIDDDGYFGELAHGLRFSTPADQARMLAELGQSRNGFGAEVLASTFGNKVLLDQLPSATQAALLDVLAAQEPGFPFALDRFGVIDMVRYATWIDAVASIEATLGRRSYAEAIAARLSDPKVDPRKILAVFSNPEGQRVIRETKDGARLRQLHARAQAFASSLPQNTMLKEAAALFSSRLNGGQGAAGTRD